MMAPKLEKPLNQPDFDQISVSTDGGLASKDAKVVVLRKLKRAHEEITGGRNVEEVLRDHAFTREQFEQALIEAPTSRTELSWLRDYISARRELEHLRIENTQLKSAIADLSVKLNTRS